ncbi:helix-turn-helix domain-containing protein [Halapricum hydrolyticum]|uniref:Helix-turn-helix domain-containing protein n=1 Tax=Halapricum hydrolyticum TaxID=2979991 RepID=A0AAE3I9A1_9EURY|nr:helix-turn-helix domain-containing protein [Halapricum hydrolyticum]MCU4717326.1 helix-turn-helix domain-containing protein [Halapricum hydrolyticum]MCU4726253.1 helix-turn-helix domain-containing protein [Halapricum hydrolyticum]
MELTATPDPESVPPFFEVIADAPFVAETRLVDWNLGDTDRPTLLYSITGDEAAFREAIERTGIPVSWDVTTIDDGRFYCYLRVDPVSQLATVLEAASTEGLVVVKPVVYRDGSVTARLVGESEVLQSVLRSMPSIVEIDVRAIGEHAGGRTDPLAALSERQREVLEVALEMGYFQQPRRVTHADVAERLGCASSTVSEHLQKAQAKLVRAAVADVRETEPRQ